MHGLKRGLLRSGKISWLRVHLVLGGEEVEGQVAIGDWLNSGVEEGPVFDVEAANPGSMRRSPNS